ncbi:uncharacterized protein LOC134328822 [Trichomycterus rosablanca]|uniref:uncharacterized protein LOC134328822 n=1 Tax=Trichomycterus rosablanca TaxID=2290929 RepID=UPI002F35A4E4
MGFGGKYTFCNLRTSMVHHTKNLSPSKRLTVHRAMCHSEAVASKFYIPLNTVREAAEVRRLQEGDESQSQHPPPRPLAHPPKNRIAAVLFGEQQIRGFGRATRGGCGHGDGLPSASVAWPEAEAGQDIGIGGFVRFQENGQFPRSLEFQGRSLGCVLLQQPATGTPSDGSTAVPGPHLLPDHCEGQATGLGGHSEKQAPHVAYEADGAV